MQIDNAIDYRTKLVRDTIEKAKKNRLESPMPLNEGRNYLDDIIDSQRASENQRKLVKEIVEKGKINQQIKKEFPVEEIKPDTEIVPVKPSATYVYPKSEEIFPKVPELEARVSEKEDVFKFEMPQWWKNYLNEKYKTEERDYTLIKGIADGTASGLTQLGTFVGTVIQATGSKVGNQAIKNLGEELYKTWEFVGEKFKQPEYLSGEVFKNPELMLKGTWWAYNTAQMMPSFVAALIPGMATAKYITVLGSRVPFTVQTIERLAKLGGSLSGGGIGGLMEGVSTYQEVLKRGGTEDEAASAMLQMSLASGALNALSINRIISKLPEGTTAKILNYIANGATEGVTEYLEEPAEAYIKMRTIPGRFTWDDAVEQMRAGANVIGPAMLTGGIGSVFVNPVTGKKEMKPFVEPQKEEFTEQGKILKEIEGYFGKAEARQEQKEITEPKPAEIPPAITEKPAVAEIPSEPTKIPAEKEVWEMTKEEVEKNPDVLLSEELKRLEGHRARIKGLNLVNDAIAKDFLKNLENAVKEKSPGLIELAERALDAYYERDYQKAIKLSEIALSSLHQEGKEVLRGERIVNLHESIIRERIEQGKPVPDNVLADYPDLQKQAKAEGEPVKKIRSKPKPEYKFTEQELDDLNVVFEDIRQGEAGYRQATENRETGEWTYTGSKSTYQSYLQGRGAVKSLLRLKDKIEQGKPLTKNQYDKLKDLIDKSNEFYKRMEAEAKWEERGKFEPLPIEEGEGELLKVNELEKGEKFTINKEEFEVAERTDKGVILVDDSIIKLADFDQIVIDKGSFVKTGEPAGKPISELKEKAPESELSMFPESERPTKATAMFDIKDATTGEPIKAGETTWKYSKLGEVSEETHRKLMQKIQKTGELFTEEEIKAGVPKKEIEGQEKLFEGKAESNIKTALKESAKSINALFGAEKIGIKGGIDEITYQQAKVHFDKAWEAYKAAGKDIKTFIEDMVKEIGKHIKPYLDRWKETLPIEPKGKTPEWLEKFREKTPEEQEEALHSLRMRKVVIPEQGTEKITISEGVKRTEEEKIPETIYDKAVKSEKRGFFGFKWNKKIKSSRGGLVSDLLVPISSRLSKINPSIASALRKFEYNVETQKLDDIEKVLPFLQKTKKMSRADRIIFDLACKNSDWNKISEIAKKYKMENEMKQFRDAFDGLYGRANEVGFEVDYMINHFPRTLRDKQGFLIYLRGTNDWGQISENIKIKEEKLGRPLSVEEKALIADNVIRGYGARKLAVGKPGYLKERNIRIIDDVLNKFYYDTPSSIMMYISRVNDAIEVRRFFGKSKPKPIRPETLKIIGRNVYFEGENIAKVKLVNDKYVIDGVSDRTFNNMGEVKDYIRETRPELEETKLEEIRESHDINVEDIDRSIGDYTARLIEKKIITPEQENEIISLLRSRFGYRHTRGSLAAVKNTLYMTTLNNVVNTVTQFGDLAWAYYMIEPITVTKNLIKASVGKSRITKRDIGITQIGQEFSSMGKTAKALNKVFDMIGFTYIDRLGKETLINSVVDRIQNQAKKDKIDPYFRRKLEKVFGNETDKVIEELKSGEMTENVKLLAFNTLLDFQPVALSEMPKFYVDSPNARPTYMLKTFTIKQFDIFNREVIREMKAAKTPAEKSKAIGRAVRLIGVFVLANATSDEIKNWILGRDETFSDKVWDNVLRLLGLSRFIVYNTGRHGLADTIWRTISPPLNIIEKPFNDTRRLVKAWENEKLGEFKIKDIETWRIIPFFGQQYHYWFGRGEEPREKYNYQIKIDEALETGDTKRLNEIKTEMEKDEFDEKSIKSLIKSREKELLKDVTKIIKQSKIKIFTAAEKNKLYNMIAEDERKGKLDSDKAMSLRLNFRNNQRILNLKR